MESTYNVKISFKGEGSFAFTLPKYGDLTVYANKDIFVKGITVSGIELLRQLRPLKLEHQLNAKPDGCYRVIDLTTTTNVVKPTFERAYKEPAPVSVADLKASMIKTTGPIDPNEGKEEVKPEVKEEVKPEVKEPKVEAPKVNKPALKTTNKSKAKSGKKKNSKK